MPDAAPRPSLSRCVVEEWSLRDRLNALTASLNTLSGIVALLECGDEPRSTSQIHKRIAEYGFGADHDTLGAITFGPLRDKLAFLSDEFTLVDSYDETPINKGRGGRIEATEVTVFEKDPRGYWFGDPIAARVLATCSDLRLSPTDIFTSAEKKGETRASLTTALILYVLRSAGTLSEQEVLTACFWEPTDREQYQALRVRMHKNVKRLDDSGLVERESFQEMVLRHAGNDLDTYPRMSDGSRLISETERIISYLEGRVDVRRQTLVDEVQTHHTQRILTHVREEGVVELVQGGRTIEPGSP